MFQELDLLTLNEYKFSSNTHILGLFYVANKIQYYINFLQPLNKLPQTRYLGKMEMYSFVIQETVRPKLRC
jgi:hypothetical protein